MAPFQPTPPDGAADRRDIGRKRRGHYPTPPELVDRVVGAVMPTVGPGDVVRIVDPACGDGRFLIAAAAWAAERGAGVELHGVELDEATADIARRAIATVPAARHAHVDVADALDYAWALGAYDVVLGNPPYLSQLATATTRGGRSSRGGGPYADVAAEFLHLAVQLARPGGGRVGLVLPQSILASRDTAGIRAAVDAEAVRCWSWWSPAQLFDAAVHVCALGFERRATPALASGGGNSAGRADDPPLVWNDVVLSALGVPALPALDAAGTVGDRGDVSVEFRDAYYGLADAIVEEPHPTLAAIGRPRLVTSGLIDPATCHWGQRTTRFAKRSFTAPRVDVAKLTPRLQRWVASVAVPKVLVANQTSVIECVVDDDGDLVPSVPVLTVQPYPGVDPWAVAAVLTSPVATVAAWHAAAGTGLSARSVRLSPRSIAALPWPAGSLDDAVGALRDGDVPACGRLVDAAFGSDDDGRWAWWRQRLPGTRTT